jgi:pyrophosphatase PpaX
MIKAIIFDIDGVLLDSCEANFKFYCGLMQKAGYRGPARKEFPKIFHLSMVDTIRVVTGVDSEEEINRIWELGKSGEVSYDFNLLAMPKRAEQVIETLGKDFLLGIVTSRVKENVYESPLLKKLEKFFKVVVAYQDTDRHKPQPDPLLLAAKRLGLAPGECVYVGDVENDAVAARAANMKIVIYSKDKFEKADACTSSFEKIPGLIAKL